MFMKDNQKGFMFDHELKELIISSDNVAHVQLGNTLEHALLVLIKSGYSAIPVLDHTYTLKGLVSKTLILDSILGIERIEYEKLSEYKVEHVMNPKVPRMKETDSFRRAMELSINNNFICIVNDEGIFTGIITRRSILALVYQYFRQQSKGE